MSKFKVGDKVRVTRRGTHRFPVGHRGTITYAEYNKPAQPLRVGEGEGNWVYQDEVELVNKETKSIKKEKTIMTTIREKIRYAALSKDEKLLRESNILSDNGNLTAVGRRVVLDILFEDKELRKKVVSAVESTIDKK